MMRTAVASIAESLHAAEQRLAAAGVDDAHLEAELLLAHALGVSRTSLLSRLSELLTRQEADAFDALVARRLKREPLAYIVGEREFYGLRIACDATALIPRPETELLVELALREARTRTHARIADIGTGTGCIAVAIAVHAADAAVTAIERSRSALALARRNVDAHLRAGRVDLREGNLLEGAGEFDVIVANLPYVSRAAYAALQPEVLREPRDALVGGESGTDVIEALIAQAPAHLAPGGVLAVEMDPAQRDELTQVARAAFRGARIETLGDLAGHDRVLVVRQGGDELHGVA